jgi:hypothetical protein
VSTRQPAAERAIDRRDAERRQRSIRRDETIGRERAIEFADTEQKLEGIAAVGSGRPGVGSGGEHPHTFAQFSPHVNPSKMPYTRGNFIDRSRIA